MAKIKSPGGKQQKGRVAKVNSLTGKAKTGPGKSRVVQSECSIEVIELPAELHSKMVQLAEVGRAFMARHRKFSGK